MSFYFTCHSNQLTIRIDISISLDIFILNVLLLLFYYLFIFSLINYQFKKFEGCLLNNK